jgi:hypothetical protein
MQPMLQGRKGATIFKINDKPMLLKKKRPECW